VYIVISAIAGTTEIARIGFRPRLYTGANGQ
jgi:hypothetical protein